jgi:hypothetical protein
MRAAVLVNPSVSQWIATASSRLSQQLYNVDRKP